MSSNELFLGVLKKPYLIIKDHLNVSFGAYLAKFITVMLFVITSKKVKLLLKLKEKVLVYLLTMCQEPLLESMGTHR